MSNTIKALNITPFTFSKKIAMISQLKVDLDMQKKHYIIGFVIFIAILLAGTTIHSPMIMDDLDQLEFIKGFNCLWDCFGRDCYGLFRPSKNILFLLASILPGEVNLTAHCISALLFITASITTYSWIRLWFKDIRLAAAGVAIWCLAPTMVSSISWFSCANILLCSIFFMSALTLWEYAQCQIEESRYHRGAILFLASQLFYCASFFSYEVAIALPFIAIAQDYLRERNLLSKKSLSIYITCFAVTASMLVIRWMASSGATPLNTGFAPISNSLLIFASAFLFVDHLLLWAFPYGRQEILGTFVFGETASTGQIVFAWVFILLCIFISFRYFRRERRLVFAAFFIFTTLAPTTNFLPLRTGPFADYYLLIPSIGIVFLILELLRKSISMVNRSTLKKNALISIISILILWRGSAALMAFFWARNWQQPARLYYNSIKARTHAYRARDNLAGVLSAAGDLENAEHLARQSQMEAPWYTKSYNVLGDILNKKGEHQKAFSLFMQAVTNGIADNYTHYALAYTAETWLDDTETAYRHYAELTSQTGSTGQFREQAYANLGRLLAINNNGPDAIHTLKRGLSEFPDSILIHHNLSIAYRKTGDLVMSKHHALITKELRMKKKLNKEQIPLYLPCIITN